MKNRSLVAMVLLTIVTLGIYEIYWSVKTKGEMNALGATIPTAWLIIVPLVNIWWLWKYSEGVGKVTGEKLQPVLAFILLFLLDIIGMMVIQHYFNQETAPQQVAPVTPATPTVV